MARAPVIKIGHEAQREAEEGYGRGDGRGGRVSQTRGDIIQIGRKSKDGEREKIRERLLVGGKGKSEMSHQETRIEGAKGKQRSRVEGGAGSFQLQRTQTTKTQISRDYNSRQPVGRSSFSLLHSSYPRLPAQITSWNI